MHLLSRFKAFLTERAAPMALLWVCIAGGYRLISAEAIDLLNNKATGERFHVADFLNARLLVLLAFGFIALLALFAILEKLWPLGAYEQKNARLFVERLWDELSSASTHLGLGTLALWFSDSPAPTPFPWGTLMYLAFAVFAFRHQSATGSKGR